MVSGTKPHVTGTFTQAKAFIPTFSDRLISPWDFAVVLCHDLRINSNQYAESIASMIVGQCEEYNELLNIDILDDADVENTLPEEGEDADVVSSTTEKLIGSGLRSRGTSAGISTPGLGTPVTGANTPLPDDSTMTSRADSPTVGPGKRRGPLLDLDRVQKRVRFNRPGDVDVVKDENGDTKEAGAAPKESEAEESDCRVIINVRLLHRQTACLVPLLICKSSAIRNSWTFKSRPTIFEIASNGIFLRP